MVSSNIPNGIDTLYYEPDYEEPLKVIIVGGGITGLASAVALRQAGHLVTVYEQSKFEDENGLVIRLGPNSSGLLKRFGFDSSTCNAVNITHVTEFNLDGTQKNEKDATKLDDLYQHPWEYYDRAELHAALLEVATSSTGKGSPIKIVLNSPVSKVEAATATIFLENGETVKGDAVIAADGVYSPIRKAIFRIPASPIQPGKVAINFKLSVSDIMENSIVARFENRHGRFETWTNDGRQMDIYRVHKGSLIFNCAYVIARKDSKDMDGAALRDEVLDNFKGFPPDLLQILQKIDPKEIRSWPQNDIPVVETWSQGKLTLTGDAAHPFLAYEAQGSAHALEDAAALGAVLPFGTIPEEVESRLKVFQKSRQERVNTIINFTREIGKDNSSSKIERFQKFGSYTYGHDAYDHATAQLRQHIVEESHCFRRMPTAFGIAPSPRQSLTGKRFNYTETTFRTASITFETSRTYLESFLPTSAYSIVSPGTIALATFYTSTIGNLQWLGGRGYNVFGLYIHNVQVQPSGTDEDSKPKTGRYLPVLFENLADPIITGREDLGFAKVFATLDIRSTADQYKLVAGWEGTPFAEMTLEGLQMEATNGVSAVKPPLRKSLTSIPDEGVLHYKCMPATGRPGEADVAYPTMTPNPSDENKALKPVVKKRLVAAPGKARIEFLKQSKKNLPTLWNVVEGLRGIEIFRVVGAEVVEGLGGNEVAHQIRP